MKSVLQNIDIKLCPRHNEGKSVKEKYVIAELVYIDKLDDNVINTKIHIKA